MQNHLQPTVVTPTTDDSASPSNTEQFRNRKPIDIMKPRNTTQTRRLMAAAILAGGVLASANTFAADDILFGPTGTEASISNPDGTWINMWGPAFAGTTFDTGNPPPSGNTQGAVYIQGNWSGSDADNYNMVSPKTWWGEAHFDGIAYDRLEFDFKYDTNSTIAPAGNAHIEFGLDTGYNFHSISNIHPNSSVLGDGSWHHVTVKIPSTMSGVGAADGVGMYQWNPGPTAGTMNYWMANLVAIAKIVPIPPPTINQLTKPSPGLNVFASTMGNSFFDRQEAMWRTNVGVGWVNIASGGNPVTYSFTITNFPANSTNVEAYLFLVPNPTAIDSAPDWNQAHCMIAYVQMNVTNGVPFGILRLRYKVNEANQQAMYSGGVDTRTTGTSTNVFYYTNAVGSQPGGLVYEEISPGVTNIYGETGNLGSVTNDTPLGTWTIRFTSDTSITLIAPNGNTSSFSMPAYNTTYFAESTGFNLFLGMQANDAVSINQAVVYSRFSVSGMPAAYTENFLADTVLDPNVWQTSMSGGPAGVLIVPTPVGTSYWMDWNLPDTLFVPESSVNFTDPLTWNVADGPSFFLQGIHRKLVTIPPATPKEFFRLAKRAFTQLQVLLPGETNAPNTLTGKVGTPSPVASGAFVTVTVNAVDSTFHIVSSLDTVALTSTQVSDIMPVDAALVSGTLQTSVQVGDPGDRTFTATDVTDGTKTPGTSSTQTVQ
jgi:hypothetical protein